MCVRGREREGEKGRGAMSGEEEEGLERRGQRSDAYLICKLKKWDCTMLYS